MLTTVVDRPCSLDCFSSPPQGELSALTGQLEDLERKCTTTDKAAKNLKEQNEELQVSSV